MNTIKDFKDNKTGNVLAHAAIGDGYVYGVSGTAPDQELLNKLNWTELHN